MPAWIWYGLGAIGGGTVLWWIFGGHSSPSGPSYPITMGPGGSQTPLGAGSWTMGNQAPIASVPLGPGVMGTGTLPSPT